MIRVTKYRTADGAEYTNRFYAKDHEDSMLCWLKEVKEKCVFMDHDHISAEITGINADNLYWEIDRAFKAAAYIGIKEDLSVFAWLHLCGMHKLDLDMNKLMRKRGLYKLNNIGLWEECHD